MDVLDLITTCVFRDKSVLGKSSNLDTQRLHPPANPPADELFECLTIL